MMTPPTRRTTYRNPTGTNSSTTFDDAAHTPDDVPESYWHEFKYYIRCRRVQSGRGIPVVALRKAPFEVTLRLLTSVMNSVNQYSVSITNHCVRPRIVRAGQLL